MARLRPLAGALLLAACSGGERPAASGGTAPACAESATWRALATSADRERLRRWRDAWLQALPEARTASAAEVATMGPLANPDLALTGAMPPAGSYTCRVYKLGARTPGMLPFVGYPPFQCRIDADGSFAKLTGSQRPVGKLYPSTDTRVVFLGTLVLGDEPGPLAYGTDAQRDMAGFVERVDERRWRLVLPYPAFESVIDVIELVPS
jgi:hypothetical protein